MRILVLLLITLLCCGACKEQYDHKGKTALVEVDGNFLYKEDLMSVLPVGLSKDDSILFAEHYIRSWAEEILLYEKAANNIPDNVDVDKLVENYRKALIMHTYQQELINQKLTNDISEQEIADYYEKNKELFKLESPLIKGLFIKVPLTAPQLNNVRRWYKTEKQDAVESLEKYSLQNAVKYEYFYNKWVPVTDVLDLIPLKEASPEQYVDKHRHVELKDTAFYYFLNVSDYRGAGEEKPYEFARSEVKDLLVNQKRVNFMEQVKNDLYQQAVNKKKIMYNYEIQRMKKFVNFRFIVTLVLAVFANVVTYAQDNVIDEVVWVVGDEAILKSDVEEARMDALYNGRRFEGDPYCVIPEEIAVQKLFLHQAKLDSIEVSEAEIIQRVDMMTNMYIQQIGSKEKMEEYFNKTATQIRETLRENARDGLTVQKMQQKLVGDIKVTPAEVRRYFKDLPQDSIPYIPTQVEVQIITLQPKIPIAEIEDVKRRLRDYTDRVTKGEIDFSTLARLYSEDKASAIKGGELDFMGRGMLDPAYANVAFSLQDPKKVSKIVESEFGYHIIQLIEKRGDRVNTRHILLRPKVSEKELTEACARLDSIGDDIRQNKFTFDEAASVISQDKDTRNNHGLMVNTNERTGITTSKFQMQDLPQDVAKVVDKMNVGEISRAFTMINEKDGKEVCAIVKLKAKINGHKATIAEDYQDLKEIVMDKRREEMLQKWILNKQKHTYVRIDPNWQKCDFKYPGWVRND